MRKVIIPVLLFLVLQSVTAQQIPETENEEYQIATVMAVRPVDPDPEGKPAQNKYEVSLQTKDTLYTVLFTDREGMGAIKQRPGLSVLVLVKDNTVTYNDLMGRSTSLPIISSKPAPPKESSAKPQ